MLDNQKQQKSYRLGIIAPRSFNEVNFLHELLAENLSSIGMIVTNNVTAGGETVQAYARNTLIPFTVYPVSHQVGGILISNGKIIDNSDFVYILDDGQSENARNVKTECEKRGRKYKVVPFTPLPSKQAQIDRAKVIINEALAEGLQTDLPPGMSKFANKLLKVLDA